VTYRPGRRVRVSAGAHEGHHRTPAYLKGKTGLIERVQPSGTNPETRAYGDHGLPEKSVYLVSFSQWDVWPAYRGGGDDRIYVDVFEQWLEEAE
jgi:nitrile hydratase subunit beta